MRTQGPAERRSGTPGVRTRPPQVPLCSLHAESRARTEYAGASRYCRPLGPALPKHVLCHFWDLQSATQICRGPTPQGCMGSHVVWVCIGYASRCCLRMRECVKSLVASWCCRRVPVDHGGDAGAWVPRHAPVPAAPGRPRLLPPVLLPGAWRPPVGWGGVGVGVGCLWGWGGLRSGRPSLS